MGVKAGQAVLIAIATEVLAVLTLVLIVGFTGPSEPAATQAYAEQLGYWVGPCAGFLFCVIGGWFIARRASTHQLLNGLVVGVFAAIVDISILLVSEADFQMVFVFSNLGRLLGGMIGGWLGSQSTASRSMVPPS